MKAQTGMNPTTEIAAPVAPQTGAMNATSRLRLKRFVLVLVLLLFCFAKPLWDLIRFALNSDLYSHILLVPFIALYLGWRRREALLVKPERAVMVTLLPFLLGTVALIAYGLARARGFSFVIDDYLSIVLWAFVCLVWGIGLLTLGVGAVRALAFPFGFLLFMVPFPAVVTHGLEAFFQHASAETVNVFFRGSGTSFSRDGMIFAFSDLRIRVGEECSGIHSSLVLFITSLLGGYLLLQSGWRRTALALFVIPLAIVRNAFRIFVLVMLTLHVNPNAIHSPIHTRGGPIFFVLSLVPFFLMLIWLRRKERATDQKQGAQH